jgi:hypothetical protein
VGDFTPAYSILPAKLMAPILQLGDQLKVLYLIRDPLARLWSHVRMHASRTSEGEFAANCTDTLQRVIAGADGGGRCRPCGQQQQVSAGTNGSPVVEYLRGDLTTANREALLRCP